MTFVRMSLSFIFSPDSRGVFACFLKTVTQLLYNIRTSVANFRDVNSPNVCGDRFAKHIRMSRDIFWRKNWHIF